MRARCQRPSALQLPSLASGLPCSPRQAAALVSGAAGEPSPEAADEPNELLVLEWAGYEAADFWIDFQEANPETEVTLRVRRHRREHPAADGGRQRRPTSSTSTPAGSSSTSTQGLVQEIDTSKLTNWDKVPDDYKELGQVDGKQYFVPWDWGFSSILYNTEQVPEVTSWDVLFDEQYADHISMWNDGPGAVTVSSYIHGWDETAITDEQLAQIEADWIAQKPLNAFYWSSEYATCAPPSQDGTVWIAYAWQGCYASALADGARSPTPIPRRGATRGSACTASAPNSDSPELAHRVPRPQAGRGDAAATRSRSSTTAAPTRDVMAAHRGPGPDRGRSGSTIRPSSRSTNFTPLVTAEQRDAWTAMWERVQAE